VDITAIYKIAGLGIIVAILHIFLTQAGRQEQAQMLSLAGVIIVLLWLVQMISRQVDTGLHTADHTLCQSTLSEP
jgi:stage III sporulation protein AC